MILKKSESGEDVKVIEQVLLTFPKSLLTIAYKAHKSKHSTEDKYHDDEN